MFKNLSKIEFINALDYLIGALGVKEDLPRKKLMTLLEKNDIQSCVQEIAHNLGLPIRINLTFVPKKYTLGETKGFTSTSMAGTDSKGKVIEEIIAQVLIPPDLPMFGTTKLQNYPIQVRIREGCHKKPDTFIAIIAHELSHVLLTSIRSPHKDSELHTDLVPFLLGFRDFIRIGRKEINHCTFGNATMTHTKSYGYLTDSQYCFASRYITEILEPNLKNKSVLKKITKQVNRRFNKALREFVLFRDYLEFLDKHPPIKMKIEHAEKVVAFHSIGYSKELKKIINSNKETIKKTIEFLELLHLYTNASDSQIKKYTQRLKLIEEDLSKVIKQIKTDRKILQKYVIFSYSLKRSIREFFFDSQDVALFLRDCFIDE